MPETVIATVRMGELLSTPHALAALVRLWNTSPEARAFVIFADPISERFVQACTPTRGSIEYGLIVDLPTVQMNRVAQARARAVFGADPVEGEELHQTAFRRCLSRPADALAMIHTVLTAVHLLPSIVPIEITFGW
jgi:hypothetical protein